MTVTVIDTIIYISSILIHNLPSMIYCYLLRENTKIMKLFV